VLRFWFYGEDLELFNLGETGQRWLDQHRHRPPAGTADQPPLVVGDVPRVATRASGGQMNADTGRVGVAALPGGKVQIRMTALGSNGIVVTSARTSRLDATP
jgi:hypothetical protein